MRQWVVLGFSGLLGCALSGGGNFTGVPDGGDTKADAGSDAGTCHASDSRICDPAASPSLYVSSLAPEGGTGATPADPIASLSEAIARALACPGGPCNVRIAEGVYESEETLALVSGVHLFGGYAPDFSRRDPAEHPVRISSTAARAVVADKLTAPTVLSGLAIEGARFTAQDGASSYALWVRDSADHLFLQGVTIYAGQGGRGVRGTDGALSQCDARGGVGGESTDCESSKGGDGSAGADEARGGAGGAPGNSNCPSACPLVGRDGISDGEPGADGHDGANGERGRAATDIKGKFVDGLWVPAEGTEGGRGKNGTGGGGGGAGGTKRIRACFGCDTLLGGRGGDGAPGGCGGEGGMAGGPGGGAFGLVAVNSTVTLDGVTLYGGRGGAGGTGGQGADGGAPGELRLDTRSDGLERQCGLIMYYSGNGGPGGRGGAGGTGGGGAGGVGGAAITLVTVDKGAVVKAGEVEITAGEAGAGGPGGGSSVARGEAGRRGFSAAEAHF